MRIQSKLLPVIPLVLLLGCNSALTAQPEKNKDIVHRFVEAINNRTYDLLDELVAPDFVRHCQATPSVHVQSRDDLKQFLGQDLDVFPDSRITIKMLVAEGDMVAGYLLFEGTQKGRMGPFPASGKKVSSNFISFIRFESGKIAEMWVEWDNLAILSQLGYWPPEEKNAE